MKFMKGLVLFIAATSLSAHAAETSTTMSTTIIPSVSAPTFGDFKLKAGYRSQNTQGRGYELKDPKGRRYKSKNEANAGLIHKSGWGFQVQGVNSGTAYGDESKDKFVKADPSVTIYHPTLFENGDLKVTGSLRRYFAVTDRSRDRGQKQYSYYLNTNYKFGKGFSLFNQLTPRYFDQNYYKPSDTTYYIEDWTALTYQQNNWLRYGLGQHAQVEWHDKTHTGGVVEVYPFVIFALSSNVQIEPRFYVPVYKDEQVYDSPVALNSKNTQAEISLSITL